MTTTTQQKNDKLILFLFSLLIMTLNTQKAISQSALKRQTSCYEISFSTNYLNYGVQPHISIDDSVRNISLSNKLGYGLCIYKNFAITSGTIIRTGLQGQFHKNTIDYKLYNGNQAINANTISCSVPLSFIYIFNIKNKKPVAAKPYLLAGAKYAALAALSDKKNIYFQPHDVMLDLGAGVHLYSKKKHLVALEFIFSKGFLNVKERSSADIYNKAIDKLFRQTFMFSLNIS
jgi:hypothetical protein